LERSVIHADWEKNPAIYDQGYLSVNTIHHDLQLLPLLRTHAGPRAKLLRASSAIPDARVAFSAGLGDPEASVLEFEQEPTPFQLQGQNSIAPAGVVVPELNEELCRLLEP
jgi:hypothetical protein